MTNMSSTATTFSGYPAGNDNSAKVLPTPAVTSTGGDMAKFQSTKVGGKRRRRGNKSSKRQRKSSAKRSHKRTQKNRR